MARIPQAPAEGLGDEHSYEGKDRLRIAQPGRGEQRFTAAQSAMKSVVPLNAGQHRGDQNEQRRPGRESVVLLIRGEGKEKQNEGGKEAEQPDSVSAEPVLDYHSGEVRVGVFVKDDIYDRALVVAEVLHPVVAGLPCNCHECRQEEAPWKEPGQVQQPIPGERQLIEVVRKARSGEAKDVFVEEVEVPETVNVAKG